MKNKVHYKSFHISGFTYYEGPLLAKKLKLGQKLKLKAEPENRYDENAVAVYYKNKKIGFVPKNKNYSMAKLLNQGHNPFKVVIQQVDKHVHPEQQYRVTVYIKKSEVLKETEKPKEKTPIKIPSWLFEGETDEKLIELKKALDDLFEEKED